MISAAAFAVGSRLRCTLHLPGTRPIGDQPDAAEARDVRQHLAERRADFVDAGYVAFVSLPSPQPLPDIEPDASNPIMASSGAGGWRRLGVFGVHGWGKQPGDRQGAGDRRVQARSRSIPCPVPIGCFANDISSQPGLPWHPRFRAPARRARIPGLPTRRCGTVPSPPAKRRGLRGRWESAALRQAQT
jgi:hypothetical protein